jgi:hypothetical protein
MTAQSQYAAGRSNDRIARLNAQLSEDQALTAERRGKILAQRQRTEVQQVIGAQRAALAANGIRVDSVLASQLAMDSGMAGERDALEIENAAALEAMGFRTQGISTRLSGELARIEGRSDAINTAVRGVADTYATYKGIRR